MVKKGMKLKTKQGELAEIVNNCFFYFFYYKDTRKNLEPV